MTQHPEDAAKQDAASALPFRISAEQIKNFEEQGYLVVDNVLCQGEVQNARREADGLEFFPTGQHGSAVRTDEVRWLRFDDPNDSSNAPGSTPVIGLGLATAVHRLRAVALQLKLHKFRGFQAREFAPVSLGVPRALQLSRYPPQDGDSVPLYRPHLDGYPCKPWSLRALGHRLMHPQQSAVAARQLTAILYLQHPEAFSLSSQEGGELVLHLKEPVAIAPVCGRLILFDSKTVVHEVVPHSSAMPRMALTCWIGGAHSFW